MARTLRISYDNALARRGEADDAMEQWKESSGANENTLVADAVGMSQMAATWYLAAHVAKQPDSPSNIYRPKKLMALAPASSEDRFSG